MWLKIITAQHLTEELIWFFKIKTFFSRSNAFLQPLLRCCWLETGFILNLFELANLVKHILARKISRKNVLRVCGPPGEIYYHFLFRKNKKHIFLVSGSLKSRLESKTWDSIQTYNLWLENQPERSTKVLWKPFNFWKSFGLIFGYWSLKMPRNIKNR